MSLNGHNYNKSQRVRHTSETESELQENESLEEPIQEGFDECLIVEIKKYPNIYTHKNKKGGIPVTEAWKVISQKTGKSVEQCEHRYKRLRQYFSKERGKREQGQKGKFQLYDLMAYMGPYIFKKGKKKSETPKESFSPPSAPATADFLNENKENAGDCQEETIEVTTVPNSVGYIVPVWPEDVDLADFYGEAPNDGDNNQLGKDTSSSSPNSPLQDLTNKSTTSSSGQKITHAISPSQTTSNSGNTSHTPATSHQQTGHLASLVLNSPVIPVTSDEDANEKIKRKKNKTTATFITEKLREITIADKKKEVIGKIMKVIYPCDLD